MNSLFFRRLIISRYITSYSLFFLLIAILVGTGGRILLTILSPLVIIAICVQLRLKLTGPVLLIFCLVIASLALSFLNGRYLNFKLLSLFNMLPFLLFLFSTIGRPADIRDQSLTQRFIKCLTLIGVINNLLGFIQVIRNPVGDDSFVGLYSTFSVSLNGLVIYNAILFFYYFCFFISEKKFEDLLWSIFFLISFVMGFYGAGLVVILVSLVLVFYRPRISDILKTVAVSVLSLIAIYYLLLYLKPNVLDYNLRNVQKLLNLNISDAPRKVLSFYNYAIAYTADAKDFLFGSGPGTFNSRSAFTVGSPTFFPLAEPIKSEAGPYYFLNFAYPLWNSTNTSAEQFLDGFRNQPFSSILAFLGEYGFIFTITFIALYFRQMKKILRKPLISYPPPYTAFTRVYKFVSILLLLLLLIDNFFEYPEIVILILTVMKTLEVDIQNIRNNTQ